MRQGAEAISHFYGKLGKMIPSILMESHRGSNCAHLVHGEIHGKHV